MANVEDHLVAEFIPLVKDKLKDNPKYRHDPNVRIHDHMAWKIKNYSSSTSRIHSTEEESTLLIYRWL